MNRKNKPKYLNRYIMLKPQCSKDEHKPLKEASEKRN